MKKSYYLASRLREVILDGTWIAGTNYKDQLTGLNWKEATTQVLFYNTIAKLTFHINYYIEGVLKVFRGGELEIRDKYSFDMKPLTNEEEWENLKNSLFKNSESLANEIEKLRNEQLDEVFVKEDYGTYARNIEAIIEHSYYHLGQVSLVKKSIRERSGLKYS